MHYEIAYIILWGLSKAGVPDLSECQGQLEGGLHSHCPRLHGGYYTVGVQLQAHYKSPGHYVALNTLHIYITSRNS